MTSRSLCRWFNHFSSNVPLYLVLVVPFVLQTAGVVGVVGYLSYRSGQQAVTDLADRLMDETSDRVAEKLQTYLQTPILINRLSVDTVHQKRLDLQNTLALEAFLFQRLQKFDQVTALLFASPEGVFRGVERSPTLNLVVANPDRPETTFVYRLDNQGRQGQRINTLSGMDVRRDRPWYKRAVQTGKLGWNPIFQHGPDQSLVLNASQPVYDQTTNRLLGVFSVHLRLDYLSKFLQSLASRHSGQIIILDQDGKLIATSTQEPIYEPQSEAGYRSQFKQLSIQESRDDLTRSLGEYLRDQANTLVDARPHPYFTFRYKGKRQFVQIVPFQDPYGLKWQILMVVPESGFMANIQQNVHTTALLCLLALAGTIVLGAAIASRVTAHIRRLNQASQALAAGDLTQQVPTDSAITEVKELAQLFNQMGSRLQQSFEHLEQAFEESEEKFTTVFRTSPDPIGIFSFAEGRVLEANNSLIEFFGYSREDFVGRTAAELMLWHDTQERQQYRQQLQQHGRVHNLEITCHTRSGELRTGLISAELKLLEGQLCTIAVLKDISDRKQAEMALQQSESRFRRVADSNIVGMILTTPTGEISEANDAFLQTVGYDRADLLAGNLRWDTLTPPEYAEADAEAVAHLLTHGWVQPFEKEYIRKDGSRVAVLVGGALVEGSTNQVISIILDISDRKAAETALRQSEKRYRCLVEVTPHLVWTANAQGRNTYASQQACDYIGLPLEQLLNLDWLTVIHPDDVERVHHCWMESVRTGTPYETEYRLRRSDGVYRWYLERALPFRDEQGQILQWFGVSTDIDDRKQTETALRESEERLRFALESARMGNWDWNLVTNQVIWSESLERLMGLQPGIFDGRFETIAAMIYPDDLPRVLAAITRSVEQGDEYDIEFRFVKPDGSIRWAVGKGNVLRDQSGRAIRMAGVDVDITDRKLGELALEQESHRRRILFDTSFDGIVIVDQAGNVVEANASFARMLGYSLAEVTALNLTDFDAHWTQEEMEQKIDEADFCSNTFETRHRRKDGSIYHVEISSNLVDWDGQSVQFCICRDISDRKAAEAALRHSQAALTEAQQIAHLGNWEFHVQTQRIIWSEELFRMFGLDPSQPEPPYADYLRHHIHPDDRLELQQCIEQAIATKTGYTVDYRAVLPDGSIRYHEGRGNVELDAQGQVIRLFGIALDITDRKRVENALRESEVRFRSVFEQAAVGLEYTDLEGRFLLVNSTLAELLGYPEEELLSLRFQDITHPEDLPQNQIYFQRLLAGEMASYCLEKRFLHKDGSLIWVNLTVSLIRDAVGQPQLTLAVVEDIRDRKQTALELQQAKEAAEAANLAKSTFLANMSHELRTPLNVILGYAQLLSYDTSLAPQYQEYLRSIHRSGDHLLSLINDVLDLSKIEAGCLTLDQSDFNLPDLLQTLSEMFRLRAESKGLKLNLELENLPKCITADQNKLRQVMINLLNNAIKFTESGTITLRAQVREAESQPSRKQASQPAHAPTHSSSPVPIHPSTLLYIDIEDTGVGIALHEMDMIFEAFAQARAGKGSIEGTGLGLTISQKFVQLMGGQLLVDSTLGQGSRFSFWIPVQFVEPDDMQPPMPDRSIVNVLPGQPTYRILVVDDQPANRQLLTHLLRKVGLEVQEVASGAAAIEQWQTWHPDLIYMDIRMGDMTGYEAMQQIRASERAGRGEPMESGDESGDEWMSENRNSSPSPRSPIPIIAVTAQAFQEDCDRSLAAGFTGFITKPFKATAIFQQLAIHLGLQYQYAESGGPEAIALPTADMDTYILKPEDLQVMPAEWIARLHNAALNCSSRAVEGLIAQIPGQQADLANGLKHLVHNYEFEIIMCLTKPPSLTD